MPELQQAVELDSRWNAGISVLLLWQPPDDSLIVAVCDTKTGDAFEVEVRPTEALEVFQHPYAYAERAKAA